MRELTMKELHEYAAENKVKYPVGSRLVVLKMRDDRENYPCLPGPVLAGTRGTVVLVDDMGQVHCVFDNGRRTALNEADDFRPLSRNELEEEKCMETVKSIIKTDEEGDYFYDCLYGEIVKQFISDNETPRHCLSHVVNRYIAVADAKGTIDLAFEALTGWKLSTLMSNALNVMNDNSFEASDGETYTEIGTKHISEVERGNLIYFDGDVYEATCDAYLTDTDNGKEWNVDVDGSGCLEYLYASYFEGGNVTLVEQVEIGEEDD